MKELNKNIMEPSEDEIANHMYVLRDPLINAFSNTVICLTGWKHAHQKPLLLNNRHFDQVDAISFADESKSSTIRRNINHSSLRKGARRISTEKQDDDDEKKQIAGTQVWTKLMQ